MKVASARRTRQQMAIASWQAVGDHIGFSFPVAAAAALQAQLVGTVVLSTDPGYLAARQVFVPNYQEFPQVVVYCEVFNDVVHCLDFARQFGLWVTCRSGGHSTAGYSVNSGMVVDISRIDDVVVDPAAKRATVGAGAAFGKLNAVLDTYHLHVPGGGCGDVGVGGYVQGGGYGSTSLIHGLNIDSLDSALLALYDGTLVTASATENPDLFWAIRGGTGGNFGVLLQVTYRLSDLWQVWGFGIQWAAADAPAALDALQRGFTGSAVPPNLCFQAILQSAGGGANLVALGMYDGDPDDGKAVLAPLLATAGATFSDYGVGPYLTLNEQLFGGDPSPQPRTLADSRYVSATLGVDRWRKVVELCQRSPNDTNFIAFEPYGGAVLEVSARASAFIHRNAGFDVFIWVFWMDDAEREHSMRYLDDFDAVLGELGNGEAFQNYPRRANRNFAAMYWGASYPTLQAVKAKYDPTSFFRFEQSIEPAAPPPGVALVVDVSGPIVPSSTVFRPPPTTYPTTDPTAPGAPS